MINPRDKEKIAKMYNDGWAIVEIEKKLDISRQTIAKWLEDIGIKEPRPKKNSLKDIENKVTKIINSLNDLLKSNAAASNEALGLLNKKGFYIKSQISRLNQNAVEEYKKQELIQMSEPKIKLLNEIRTLESRRIGLIRELNELTRELNYTYDTKGLHLSNVDLLNFKKNLEKEVAELENKIQYLEKHKFDNEAYKEGYVKGAKDVIYGVQKDPEKGMIKLLLAKSQLEFIEKTWNSLRK